ncbi:hypothetical protein DQQ10_00850 [Pseudochryseolinea flava]|uniref:DUF3108 domain-containing protein n=2 Tax=Pseudochryseolinea flava TaxID=2059302 RepID=A0A364Y8K4_9BACT|nr:hypothetical protein DQQ10_00850 [Pseudochryseolinea flava]
MSAQTTFREGNTWEKETHNEKGKLVERITYKVVRVDTVKKEIRITTTSFDAKGKQTRKIDMTNHDRHDTLFVDMKNYFMMRDDFSYKWRTEPSFIAYPKGLEVGQELRRATIVYVAVKAPKVATQAGPAVAKNNQVGTTATFTIESRVVEMKEEVTTPAGTFSAYKITSRTTLDNKLDYAPVEQKLIEWFVPGFGVVKSEVYKKDKNVSSWKLTKLSVSK